MGEGQMPFHGDLPDAVLSPAASQNFRSRRISGVSLCEFSGVKMAIHEPNARSHNIMK
jgi:hypothetical protein